MTSQPVRFENLSQTSELHKHKLYINRDERLTEQRWLWLQTLKADFPLEKTESPVAGPHFSYDDQGLTWHDGQSKKGIRLDFTHRRILDRLQKAGKKSELSIKACGFKGENQDSVLDATAGMGNDGLLMAKNAAKLTFTERNPIICALLRDGLHRAQEHPKLEWLEEKLSLIWGDFTHITDDASFDVVHLDPMFPATNKSALNKKGISVIQSLETPPDETEEKQLLENAIRLAQKRVIIKRPKSAPFLAGKAPDSQFLKGDFRYDVLLK